MSREVATTVTHPHQ